LRIVDSSKIFNGCEKYQVFFGIVEKNEYMFPNVGFLIQEILGIVNFQIEIKIKNFLVHIFTNLRRYCL
jgi:hypothetical protein